MKERCGNCKYYKPEKVRVRDLSYFSLAKLKTPFFTGVNGACTEGKRERERMHTERGCLRWQFCDATDDKCIELMEEWRERNEQYKNTK